MADKLTQQITDALTRLAAEPTGLPLYAAKSEPGLFANTASAKPAAQKCVADNLIRAIGTDPKAKTPRELYTLTERGWEFLLAAVNPKQVLEDFVRVLESRQGEVSELIDTAHRMATSLQGLKDAVSRVLPSVGSVQWTGDRGRGTRDKGQGIGDRGQDARLPALANRLAAVAAAHCPLPTTELPTAHCPLPTAICAYLADHTGPTDCSLPELFHALQLTESLTIGEFHDCLRALYADGAISLPAWTGPLYALPEPQYALLIGHGIAYYASLKSVQWGVSSDATAIPAHCIPEGTG